MSEPLRIRVVAAEVTRVVDGVKRFLITQRNPHAVLPLLWEFPGGKVEEGEEDHVALRRELDEEMGIAIDIDGETMAIERDYGSYIIDFHVYKAHITKGEAQRGKVFDFRWVTLSELVEHRFPPADRDSVARLLDLHA